MRYVTAIALFTLMAAVWAGGGGSISIKFADPSIPPICEKVTIEDYGVSEEPRMKVAKAEAALSLSPPDPMLFAIEWREDDSRAGHRPYYGASRYYDYHSYGHWYGNFGHRNHKRATRSHYRPRDPLPLYNTSKYYAYHGDWKRARERAMYYKLKKR